MMNLDLRKLIIAVLGIMTVTSAICASDYKSDTETVLSNNSNEEKTSESTTINNGWALSTGRYAPVSTSYTEEFQTSVTESETSVSSMITSESTVTTVISSSDTDTDTGSTGITSVSSDESTDAVTSVPETQTDLYEATVVVSETTVPVQTQVYTAPSNPVPEKTAKDESYLKKCVFVGDSIMEGLSAYKYLPESQVFASVGLNPYQLNTVKIETYYGNVTALSAVTAAKPENIYIMMGMNGVAWNMNASMTEEIGIFIDNLKTYLPSSNIYLMSVTPVSAEREAIADAASGKILNSQINEFNSKLLELANEKNIHYLDLNSSMKGANGCLPSSVTSDGIHISKAVYQDILDYILCHTVE